MMRGVAVGTPAVLALAVLSALVLAGCSDAYLDRRESVYFGAGNAQEVNAATHIINPLPPESADKYLLINGQLVQQSVSKYRTGKVGESSAPSTD